MEDYYKRIAEEYEEIYFRSDLGIQKELKMMPDVLK